jgi:hypothetical protein
MATIFCDACTRLFQGKAQPIANQTVPFKMLHPNTASFRHAAQVLKCRICSQLWEESVPGVRGNTIVTAAAFTVRLHLAEMNNLQIESWHEWKPQSLTVLNQHGATAGEWLKVENTSYLKWGWVGLEFVLAGKSSNS